MNGTSHGEIDRWRTLDLDDFDPRLKRGANALEKVSVPVAKRLNVSISGVPERTARHGPRHVISAARVDEGDAGKGPAHHVEAVPSLEMHLVKELRRIEIDLRTAEQHGRPVSALRSTDDPTMTACRDGDGERAQDGVGLVPPSIPRSLAWPHGAGRASAKVRDSALGRLSKAPSAGTLTGVSRSSIQRTSLKMAKPAS